VSNASRSPCSSAYRGSERPRWFVPGFSLRCSRKAFLPVYIRLDHEAAAKSFVRQVKAALTDAIIGARIAQPTLPETDETLWELFHRSSLRLQTWHGQPITPVLVLDQFEELFTLGARERTAQDNCEIFFTELSDLVENHPPARVHERLRSYPEQVASFGFGAAHVRVLFSLREDYLANLEDYCEQLPSIARNRMRLTLMNGQQALEAVIFPGAELVSAEVGEQIVRFVAAAGRSKEGGWRQEAGIARVRYRACVAEPFLQRTQRPAHCKRPLSNHRQSCRAKQRANSRKLLCGMLCRAVPGSQGLRRRRASDSRRLSR
jgi:hypothetical protein